ncbi:hypothetical protein LNKW23_07160 [Paralimibaculum aggregatum]|uniref:Uncharacterized protein n=1 Tax=Paralimibaculum aggregatum TaxID=3036245 RepID=A0ABQ6LL21_9RHOB|nr:hypothetical protein LNKW23_07160 [Limibaculum sp. NKW23]
MVSIRCSPSAAGAGPSACWGAPQPRQKRSAASSSAPQEAQPGAAFLPQEGQNLAAAGSGQEHSRQMRWVALNSFAPRAGFAASRKPRSRGQGKAPVRRSGRRQRPGAAARASPAAAGGAIQPAAGGAGRQTTQ